VEQNREAGQNPPRVVAPREKKNKVLTLLRQTTYKDIANNVSKFGGILSTLI
jgi:hypothetical protein